MPASRRVSLKDREERELNVRRALGAFITQPEEAQAAAALEPEEAPGSDLTDGSSGLDDTWDTKDIDVTDVTEPRASVAAAGRAKPGNAPASGGTARSEAEAAALAFTAQGAGRANRAGAPRRDMRSARVPSVTTVTDGTVEPDGAALRVRAADLPASFMLKGRRFDPPAGARKRQNYALSSETIKRIALASAHAGVGKAELVDAVLCSALRDILGDE